MARKRKDDATKIKLQQPDRSGPKEKTLLDLAKEQDLFAQADARQKKLNKAQKKKGAGDAVEDEDDDDDEGLSPTADRIMETLLWTVSLAMLHLTLDVLVQNQYAMEIQYSKIVLRAGQALLVFGFLFYCLHPHSSSPILLPGLPLRYQPALRQTIFLSGSVAAGCYLIHITNEYGYLAVMKQAPSIGCLWVWSVIELNLPLALLSLASTYGFLWHGGYSVK